MNRERFIRWINEIHATEEAEIDCDRLQELLPAFVDTELAGVLSAPVAGVLTHLLHCPDCADLYEGLREVARLETGDQLPAAEDALALLAPVPVAAHEIKRREGVPVPAP